MGQQALHVVSDSRGCVVGKYGAVGSLSEKSCCRQQVVAPHACVFQESWVSEIGSSIAVPLLGASQAACFVQQIPCAIMTFSCR
jgi:hypothetical protein